MLMCARDFIASFDRVFISCFVWSVENYRLCCVLSTFICCVSSGDCSVVGLQWLCARSTIVSASPPLFVTLPTVISGRHGNSRSVFRFKTRRCCIPQK